MSKDGPLVVGEDKSFESKAKEFALSTNLIFKGNLEDLEREPLKKIEELNKHYYLVIGSKNLYLKLGVTLKNKPIYSDFLGWSEKPMKSNILLAMKGLPKDCSVLDATAGLGQDALYLANLSKEVILLEQIPWLFSLLENGLDKAKRGHKKIFSRMHPFCVNAKEYLQKLEESPDVIYLDPMFNFSNKSKAKKDLQALRELIKEGLTNDLLQISLLKAKRRVIVKRYSKQDFLENLKPTYSIFGRVIRFDVYAISQVDLPLG